MSQTNVDGKRAEMDGQAQWACELNGQNVQTPPVRRGDQRESLVLQLEQDLLTAVADRQRQIGQDLHDVTQQELAGLGLLAHRLAQQLAGRQLPEAERAARIAEGLDLALRHVRMLAKGLVPVAVEGDNLNAALTELARSTEELSGIACRCDCDDSPPRCASATATGLYRIAQEAVTNAVKHASPQRITLRLKAGCDSVELLIEDDGTGIADQLASSGMGCRIMQYRADQIGARLEIGPATGRGTLVKCILPQKSCE